MDTRPSDGEQVIRRRRECGTCNRRFTTYERIEQEMPLIVKKDGRREPYDRAKVQAGVRKACEKRPVSIEAQDKAIEEIERALQDLGEREVVASRIGDAVLSALRRLDEVAYLRFASVYLSFNDIGELMNEVQRLMQARKTANAATSGGASSDPESPPDPKA